MSELQAKNPNKPATQGFVLKLIEAVTEGAIRRMEQLQAHIEMLESSQLRYEGVHERSKQYNQGAVVTAKGTLWHCQQSTKDVPGTSTAWKMMAKSPQAARGAK
jgi:hypothetical protein